MMRELPLFNLQTVPSAGLTGRSSLTLSGNIVLGFLTLRAPGTCAPEIPPAVKLYSYNQASKLLNEGFSYLSEIKRLQARISQPWSRPQRRSCSVDSGYLCLCVCKQPGLLPPPNNILRGIPKYETGTEQGHSH